MVNKLTVKGSTRKHRSNWNAPLLDERREEVKKRQTEAYITGGKLLIKHYY